MLVSCEVAVEYYLALIHSPQVRTHRNLTECTLLKHSGIHEACVFQDACR